MKNYLHSGRLWSETGITDLKGLAEVGVPEREIADFLLRR